MRLTRHLTLKELNALNDVTHLIRAGVITASPMQPGDVISIEQDMIEWAADTMEATIYTAQAAAQKEMVN